MSEIWAYESLLFKMLLETFLDGCSYKMLISGGSIQMIDLQELFRSAESVPATLCLANDWNPNYRRDTF